MHHRRLEAGMVQDGAENESGQFRFPANDIFGLGPDAIPDRIEGGELSVLRVDVMNYHAALMLSEYPIYNTPRPSLSAARGDRGRTNSAGKLPEKATNNLEMPANALRFTNIDGT
jgi:hypothetical protein